MSNPRLRVKASGLGGSGYIVPAAPGQPYKEVKNADGEPIRAAVNDEGKTTVYGGVTTILRMLDKPALIQWSVDLTVAWASENWQYLGTHTDEQVLRAGRWRHRDVLNERAEIGTAVHEWAEAYLNDWFDYPDLDRESEQAVQQFLDMMTTLDVQMLATEVTVYNHTLGYGGTFDLIAIIDGVLCLVDLKTSKGLWWEHEIQLSALAKAEVMLVERGDGYWDEVPMPEFESLRLIQLRPDYWDPRTKAMTRAFWHMQEVPADEVDLHFRAFAGILEAAKVKRELKVLRRDKPENF